MDGVTRQRYIDKLLGFFRRSWSKASLPMSLTAALAVMALLMFQGVDMAEYQEWKKDRQERSWQHFTSKYQSRLEQELSCRFEE